MVEIDALEPTSKNGSLTQRFAPDLPPKVKLLGVVSISAGNFRLSLEVDRRVKTLSFAFNVGTEGLWMEYARALTVDAYLYGCLLRKSVDPAHFELAAKMGVNMGLDTILFSTVNYDDEEAIENAPQGIDHVLSAFTGRSLKGYAIAYGYEQIVAAIEEDPSRLFLAFGCGVDDLLSRVRALRSLGRKDVSTSGIRPVIAVISVEEADRFWALSNRLSELSYDLKADELPASVFRSFGPMPLGGLEEDLDIYFEEAYAKVARLAQSFAISLSKSWSQADLLVGS